MSEEYVSLFQVTEEITTLTIEIGTYVGSITAFEPLHPSLVLRRRAKDSNPKAMMSEEMSVQMKISFYSC